MSFANAEIGCSPMGNGVITVEKIGTDARGLLNYVSQHEKTRAVRPFMTNMVGDGVDFSPRALAAEFALVRKLRPNLKRAVSHLIVSCGNGLSNDQLRLAISITLKMNGYDKSMFAAYFHKDTDHEHIHIFASRLYISESCRPEVVSDSKNYKRIHAGSREVERALGFAPLVMRHSTEMGLGSKRERAYSALKREARISTKAPNVVKPIFSTKELGKILVRLEEKIKSILVDENFIDLSFFEEELKKNGCDVEWARSGSPTGNIVGYSLVLSGGSRIKGSDISRSLSCAHVTTALDANVQRKRQRALTPPQGIRLGRRALPPAPVPAASAEYASAPNPNVRPQCLPPGQSLDGYTYRAVSGGDQLGWEYANSATGNAEITDAGDAIYLSSIPINEAHADHAIEAWLKLGDARLGQDLEVTGDALEDPEFGTRVVRATACLNITVHPFFSAIQLSLQARDAGAQCALDGPVDPVLDQSTLLPQELKEVLPGELWYCLASLPVPAVPEAGHLSAEAKEREIGNDETEQASQREREALALAQPTQDRALEVEPHGPLAHQSADGGRAQYERQR